MRMTATASWYTTGARGSCGIEYVDLYSMVTGHQLEWSEDAHDHGRITATSETRTRIRDTLTPIDNFIPITDDSYLSNS